jgi:hypothetical protein
MAESTLRVDVRLFLERAAAGGAISAFVAGAAGNVIAVFGEAKTTWFVMPNRPLDVGELIHFPTASGELVVVAGLPGGLLAFAVFSDSTPADTARSVVMSAAFQRLH